MMRHLNIALTPDHRCPLCRASYGKFRGGLSPAMASAMLSAEQRADDGSATYAVASDLRSEETYRATRNAGGGMKLAGQIKRAAWNETHGPGRCRFDVEGWIFGYRQAMAGVTILADREWRLRELVADLLLDEDDTSEPSEPDADVGFDVDNFDAVPMFVDDGNATTCIAA